MCRRSCFSVYLIGLNPYYTGIHLHTEKLAPRNFGNKKVLILIILEYIYIKDVPQNQETLCSLNPYYTGIHLHQYYRAEGFVSYLCLNPYYTGIHLHVRSEAKNHGLES